MIGIQEVTIHYTPHKQEDVAVNGEYFRGIYKRIYKQFYAPALKKIMFHWLNIGFSAFC